MFHNFLLSVFFLNVLTDQILCQNQSQSIDDLERCRLMYDGKRVPKDYLQEFPTGLGVGWDNLQNLPRSEIFNLTFTKCKLSPDLEYLIPDGVQVILVKTSQLDKIANYYETYNSYTESTSQSINLGVSAMIGHFGISGSFSYQSQEVKQHSLGEKSSIFRTKLDHHAYTALVEPGTELNSKFQRRFVEIGEALFKNHTKLAKYLSQLIIRDYGTHVVTTADVGATLVQEDFIDSKSLSDTKTNIYDVRAAAALSFFMAAKVDASTGRQVSSTTVSQYQSMLRHSQYTSFGGPNVNRLLDSNTTTAMKIDDLVVLDRSGIPIYLLATEDYFPFLPLPTIATIQTYLKNATEEYYARNVVKGCQDPEAENFNYQANVDDSTCHMPYNNYTFGGVYQICNVATGTNDICKNFALKNGLTGDFTCPKGEAIYDPVKLFQTSHTFPPRKESHCVENCRSCGFLWLQQCCTTTCDDEFFIDEIILDAYWCSARPGKIPADSGYLFGGLFTSKMPNPFSSNQKCPGNFVPNKIGVDLNVCMSRDFQLDYESSVKFGGFLSCGSSVERCPKGYSQHLAEIVDGCEIYYCVRPDAFAKSKKVAAIMPPFINFPYETEAFSVLQTYQDGRLWYRSADSNRSWSMTRVLQQGGKLPNHLQLLNEWNKQSVNNGTSTGIQGGLIAGIIFGCIAFIGLTMSVGYIVRNKYRSQRSNYEPIDAS